MNKLFYLLIGLFLVCCISIPSKAADSKDEKVTVSICPMSGDDADLMGPSENVGKYKVYFCCPNCVEKFAKLTEAEKVKKTEEAKKKQAAQEK